MTECLMDCGREGTDLGDGIYVCQPCIDAWWEANKDATISLAKEETRFVYCRLCEEVVLSQEDDQNHSHEWEALEEPA